MRNLFFLILLLGLSLPLSAQLTINGTLTPTQLVQNYLVGNGVTVSNVTFNGAPATTTNPQISLFNGTNTTLNMADGIIMSSGQTLNAIGPNNNSGISASMGSSAYDPDLNAICAFGVYDAAYLEFDFTAAGDSVSFNYIFASDEYMEYVGGGINDAFGIFLSGPGISGPFSNNAVNIALIPGTSTPVSIDNVNAFTNSAYYVNNGDGSTAPYNTNPIYVQYDGLTVKLTAAYPVQCGGTYHIKFAIGDGADDLLDSGVFIEGGSFSSNGFSVSLNTPTLPNATQGVVYEGCLLGSTVDFTFVRPDVTGADTAFFILGGNAVNGVDYSNISPSYVTFAPGQDSATLTISIPNDFVIEGVDTLTISSISVNACGDTVLNTATLYIHDPYPVNPFAGNDTIYNCPGTTYSFNGVVLNGNPPYNWTWNGAIPGQTISYTINQLGGDTLVLEVIDGCGYIGYDTLFLSQVPPSPLIADAGPDVTLTCAGQSVQLTGSASGGGGTVTYLWGTSTYAQDTLVQPLTTTNYILTVYNTCQQTDTDTVTVIVPPYTPYNWIVMDSLITVTCSGDPADFTAYVTSGGSAPYTYLWSNGDNDTTTTINVTGAGNLTVTVTDACGLDSTITVYYAIQNGSINFSVNGGRICRNADSTALLPYNISGGVAPLVFNMTAPPGVLNILQDTVGNYFTVSPAQSGIYTVTVTDGCGVTVTDSAIVHMRNCDLVIPNVISPNGDGVNDVFEIDGLQYHPNSILRVYNRWGQQVYYDANYQNNWDGGSLPAGVYYYILELTDGTLPPQYNGFLHIFY